MCRLIRYLRKWPVIPVFGHGEYLQQPIYVEDVAAATVQALSHEQTIRKAYNIAGKEALAYNDVLDTVCQQLNRRVKKIHFPATFIVNSLRMFEKIGLTLPIKAEQVLRLNEDKAFDFSEASHDFGYAPRSFAEGISLELQEMGLTE